jgi:hypothetical protein
MLHLKLKWTIFITFAIFLLINKIISTPANSCLKIVRETNDEDTLISQLGKRMHELKSETNQCIETLLRSGNFKSLEFFLNELNKRNIKFRETLSVAINNLQKKLALNFYLKNISFLLY